MNFDPRYSARNFASVGTRPIRPDGVDKVTGRARYGADFNMAGQLVGRVLRSPHAHATIRKIDTSKAEKLTGVKAVITAADLPDLTDGDAAMYDILDNCMARKKALYDGHAVAAVAAVDARTARQALKLIEVDYEVLPHVTDVDEAMKRSAPVLNDTIFTEGVEAKPAKPSNVTKRTQYGHGDVEQGFGQADFIVERSFKTEQTHQGYIEPHACVASVSSDGTADLWVCTQGHFVYRNHCAQLLGMDASKLRVTSSEIGGGFGGKTHVWAEPVALALSRKAGRPVKLVMTRDEVFRASGPTSATSIDVKIGARKDGTITAAEATLRYSCGPYAGMWAELGAMTAFACYELENVKTVGYEVLVNRPKTAAYRAPSAPMAAFAVESAVDELAKKIGMDPVEFRIKNAAKEGTRSSYGPMYGPIGIGPTLEAAKNHPHMKAPLGKNQGRGMACGFWFNFGGQTCTDLNIGIDGTVSLAVGTVDVGGSRASLSLMAAEELGIAYEHVKAVVADTSSLGHNDMTDGSRGTFSSAMATISAARNAIKVLARTRREDVGHSRRRRGLGRGPRDCQRREARQSSRRCRSRRSRPRRRKPADRSPATMSSSPMAPAFPSPPISAISRSIPRPAPPRCCATPSSRMPARRCIRPMWRASTRAVPRKASAGRSTRSISTARTGGCRTPASSTIASRSARTCR